MLELLQVLTALVVAYGLAVGAVLLLHGRNHHFAAVGVVLTAFIVASPVIVARAFPIHRAVVAIFATDLGFKLVDCMRQRRANRLADTPLGDLLRFLIPFPVLLVLFEYRDQKLPDVPSYRPQFRAILVGACGCIAGLCILVVYYFSHSLRTSFPLEHLVKACSFVLFVDCLARVIHAVEQLAGYDSPVPMRNPFWSQTPADFWSRWNCRVQAWFHFNVFLPSGGKRSPVRGVLVTFFLSGLLHELMFGIATSRFDGYQLIFFTIQGPAVLFARRLEWFAQRNGRPGRVLAHALTASWMILTSIFFCHGVDRIFPFVYVSEPWLP